MGKEEYVFQDVSRTAWLLEDTEALTAPYSDSEAAGTLSRYEPVTVTGTNDLQYWEITDGDQVRYIDKDDITFYAEDISSIKAEKEKDRQLAMLLEARETVAENTRAELTEKIEYERWRATLKTQTRNPNWDGPVLNRSNGSIYGPSGKETYYNLPMGGVVSIMRGMGNYDEYWVRDDGCKMLGDYIMCAANLSVHPRGSLVECSLGLCIVCDTGTFAAGNPNQLDIAVNW
jgi:hypothetical protein